WGLAQLWEGMSAEERSRVRDRLRRTSKAIGWPADPATDPPAYDGPEGIPLPDQDRIVSNYISRYCDYLVDVQKADNMRVEQEQAKWSSPRKVDTGLSFIPSVRTPPGTRTPATSAAASCCRRPRCTRRPPPGPPPAWRSSRRGPAPSSARRRSSPS